MTVTATANYVSYQGAGTAGPFPVPFRFLAASNLQVVRTSAEGDETRLVLGTDYTATGADLETGGAVTLTAALPAGQSLTILPATPIDQLTIYVPNDPFPAKTHERALDKLTLIAQSLRATLARTLTFPFVETGSAALVLAKASLRKGKLLGFSTLDGAPVLMDGQNFKGDPGGNAMAVGLFAAIGALNIPVGTDYLQSNGWSVRGVGAARYVYDPLVDAAYVAANPRTSVRSLNGRGFRLNEASFDATHYGALGDAIADDAPAIQAALNYAGVAGGGVQVLLPRPRVAYRIANGLKLPSYVGLRGESPSRYPYSAGNPGVSKLIADFANPYQWVIEADVRIAGAPLAYNAIVADNLPSQTCYNCSVTNLIITSVNALPYGGIRMCGAPGGIVRDVSVYRVGCGLLVNYGFGGVYDCHLHSAYYGAAVWGEANANRMELYCARMPAYTGPVPADYLLPFMATLNGQLPTTYKLSTNAHYNRSIGLLIGSLNSTTANVRVVEATLERFEDGLFMANCYSTWIGGLYVEGSTNDVSHALIGSNCTFHLGSLHAFLSGTGALFDFGNNVDGYVNLNGSAFVASFGKPPELELGSQIRIGTVKPGLLGVGNQFNLRFVDKDGDWITPTLTGAGNLGGNNNPFAYRISRAGKVEFRGGLTGVGTGSVPFILPAGFRPFYTQLINGFAGTADVRGSGGTPADAGKFVITSGGPTIIFDDKSFEQIS